MDESVDNPIYFDRDRDCRVYRLPERVGLSVDFRGSGDETMWTLFLDIYHPHRYPLANQPIYEADQAWPIQDFPTLDEAHKAALAIQKILGGTNNEGATRGL